MAGNTTLALVGAVGGAGTTRLAVESAATLARAGHDVAVLDAAFATQGLADYVEGRIDTDLTTVVTDGGDLADARYALAVEGGQVGLYPASAPFERLARAKTAGAAEAFQSRIGEARLAHDFVVVDTPPVAANQAVAAVTACDRVAVVAPDTERGADGLATVEGRLADVGAGVDAVVATFADGEGPLAEAVARVPTVSETAAGACPTAQDPAGDLGPPVAEFLEATLETTLDLEFTDPGRLDRVLG